MTKEEWDSAQRNLTFPGSTVYMKIDGYDIAVQVQRKSRSSLNNVLTVYVDGKIKVEWLANGCEIREKFYCRHERSLLSANAKKEIKKYRKSVRDKIIKDSLYTVYSPYWNSFRSMKSHFIKNNSSIELVSKE
ncbi:MAG: hypothetical protein Q4F95_00720 [Oscillospiraceae bacterium]|nr:hypothetical protein [Oscillospiraceae bacterium]